MAARAACPCRPGARLCKPQGARSARALIRPSFRPQSSRASARPERGAVPGSRAAPRDTNVTFKGKETESCLSISAVVSFLRLLDFSTEEIEYLLKLSKNFKDLKRTGTPHRYLEGKNIVLLFQKTSTRTRCAFEVGAMDLGMGVTYLDPGSSQMGKKESIEDTARVLGRFYDGIEFRGFAQTDRGGAGRERRRAGVERPDRPSGIPPRCSPTCSPCRRTSTTTSRA